MKKILSYFAFLVLLIFQHNSMAEIHKYTDSYGVINYHWGRSYERSNIKDRSPFGVSRKEISAFQDFLESDLMRERKYKKRTALNPLGYKYLFPIRRNDYRITQGYNGSYSHNTPQSRYAIDISVPEGTPVYAARSGKVISLRGGEGNGESISGNYIRVLHDDGTFSSYLHLQKNSIRVLVNQMVAKGEHIANSGNTGRSTGPHLHFVVQKLIGKKFLSIPHNLQSQGDVSRVE